MVRDHHERPRVGSVGECAQERDERLAPAEVEPRAGLVEQQQLRVGHQHPGHEETLALALRQRADVLGGVVAAPDELEKRVGPLVIGVGVVVPPRSRGRPRWPVRTASWALRDGRSRWSSAVLPKPMRPAGLADVDLPERVAEDGHRPVGRPPLERRRAAAATSCPDPFGPTTPSVRRRPRPSRRRAGRACRLRRGRRRRGRAPGEVLSRVRCLLGSGQYRAHGRNVEHHHRQRDPPRRLRAPPVRARVRGRA